MNGVEILSQNNIYETEVWWWIIGVFAGIGLLIGLITIMLSSCGFDGADLIGIFILIIVFAFIGLLCALITEHTTDTVEHVEYKVTIDDSVSMNEFLDKYEILDQEGKIYTVKERE